jgi:hypothetical protein
MSERKIALYEQLMDLRHAQSEAPTPEARQRIQEAIKCLLAEIDSIS